MFPTDRRRYDPPPIKWRSIDRSIDRSTKVARKHSVNQVPRAALEFFISISLLISSKIQIGWHMFHGSVQWKVIMGASGPYNRSLLQQESVSFSVAVAQCSTAVGHVFTSVDTFRVCNKSLPGCPGCPHYDRVEIRSSIPSGLDVFIFCTSRVSRRSWNLKCHFSRQISKNEGAWIDLFVQRFWHLWWDEISRLSSSRVLLSFYPNARRRVWSSNCEIAVLKEFATASFEFQCESIKYRFP